MLATVCGVFQVLMCVGQTTLMKLQHSFIRHESGDRIAWCSRFPTLAVGTWESWNMVGCVLWILALTKMSSQRTGSERSAAKVVQCQSDSHYKFSCNVEGFWNKTAAPIWTPGENSNFGLLSRFVPTLCITYSQFTLWIPLKIGFVDSRLSAAPWSVRRAHGFWFFFLTVSLI